MSANRREVLLKEYGETLSTFRLLTDIRFKLLAFLPVAAAAAVAALGIGNSDASAASLARTLALACFGLAVTLGLLTYNTRNDQLYGVLVARAAAIERDLGLPEGGFANRPQAWLRLWGVWPVSHGHGVNVIYLASIALWVFAALAAAGLLIWHWAENPDPAAEGPIWIAVAALAAAVVLVTGGAAEARAARERQAKRMRDDVRIVHAVAWRALTRARREAATSLIAWDSVPTEREFLRRCAGLADPRLADQSDRGREDVQEAVVRLRRRLEFYVTPPQSGHYVVTGTDDVVAAHLVALLTDLPPEWIFSIASGRRG